eukprot:9211332-Alexandrium_andersonii.AAC.3
MAMLQAEASPNAKLPRCLAGVWGLRFFKELRPPQLAGGNGGLWGSGIQCGGGRCPGGAPQGNNVQESRGNPHAHRANRTR